MADKIELDCHEYGHVSLFCDSEAFARLRDGIVREAGIADILRDRYGNLEPRSLKVFSCPKPEPRQPPGWPPWYLVVASITVGCVYGSAMIVGFVTIVKWLSLKLG